MKIENVAILGGNGTVGSLMGGLISGLGKANVYLIVRDKSKLDESFFDKIYSSIKSDSIKDRIYVYNYDESKTVLNKCDWIFESVAEDYYIKEKVYKLVDEFAKKDAIFTSGTSGLSINKLSEVFNEQRKKYFFGTHFFNPPYHMNLCELITTPSNDMNVVKEFREYLEKKLLRTTIIANDQPAFIANRIGFKLMNELILMADTYKERGGISYIDSLFTGYTGRNMSPFQTIDFVGLDIHKAIVDNIFENTNDEFKKHFKLPSWFNENIKNGLLGNKVKRGLYEKKDTIYEYDIIKNTYVPKRQYDWKMLEPINNYIKEGEYLKAYKELLDCSTQEKEIVVKILVEYIVYSLYISNLTAEKIEDCDDAMAAGFGWCPPIALKELIEKTYDFHALCDKFIGKEIMQKYKLDTVINNLPKSKYDYRKYIKAI